MEEERTIPFIAHESEVSRLERVIKRLWILCIVIFVALIGTNAGWIYYENRYEDIVVTQDIDTGTGNAAVSGTGDVTYGSNQTDSQGTETQDGR